MGWVGGRGGGGCGKRGRDDESDGVWGGEIRPRGAACGRARNRDRRDAVMHYLPLSFMAMRGVGWRRGGGGEGFTAGGLRSGEMIYAALEGGGGFLPDIGVGGWRNGGKTSCHGSGDSYSLGYVTYTRRKRNSVEETVDDDNDNDFLP